MFRFVPVLVLVACGSGLSQLNSFPNDGENPGDTDLPGTDTDTDTDAPTGENRAPIANAGPDLDATTEDVVVLDGTLSTDPDADELFFDWRLIESPPGFSGSILQPTRDQAELVTDIAGLYVAELEVTDGELSSIDTVEVFVTLPNGEPIARAGEDLYTDVGTRVYLDGTASSDPDGDGLNYEWTVVDHPGASNAPLNNPNLPQPNFTPDSPGTYTFQLIVIDSSGMESRPDAVRVVATTPSSGGGGVLGIDFLGCLSCSASAQGGNANGLFLFTVPFALVVRRRQRQG